MMIRMKAVLIRRNIRIPLLNNNFRVENKPPVATSKPLPLSTHTIVH